MKKKTKLILISTVALLLLVALYFIIKEPVSAIEFGGGQFGGSGAGGSW